MKKIVLGEERFFIVLLIAIMLIALCISIMVQPSQVAFASALIIEEGKYDSYTDSDDFVYKNATYTIQSYIDSGISADNVTFAKNPSYNGLNAMYNMAISGDDAIVKIIPKELLKTNGDWLYVGREYGFFVHTENAVDLGGNYTNNKLSTVFVFDIVLSGLDMSNQGLISYEVKPLFQREYQYLIPNSDTYYFDYDEDVYESVVGASATYSIASDVVVHNARVVGPFGYESVIYDYQIEKYYLKDISMVMSLLNEQAPNDSCEEYSAATDDGSYFTMFDYEYNGISKENCESVSSSSAIDFALAISSVGLSALEWIPVVGDVLSIANLAISIVSNTKTIGHYATENANLISSEDLTISNGKLTATHFYSNKDDQLAHYNKLVKTCAVIVNSTQTGKSIWYKEGNSFKGVFKIGHPESDCGEPLYTRLLSQIALKVIDENGMEIACEKGLYGTNFRSEQYIALNCNNNNLYLLNNGKNYFTYTPQFTSNYEFLLSTTKNVGLKCNGNEIESDVIGEKRLFSLRLKRGENYKFEFCGVENECIYVPFNFSPTTKTNGIALTANEDYLVKITNNGTSDVKRISYGKEIFIKSVLEYDGFSFKIRDDFENIEQVQQLDVFIKTGDSCYLLIGATSNKTAVCNISTIEAVRQNVAIDLDVSENNDYRFVSFTVTKALKYTIQIEDSENDNYIALKGAVLLNALGERNTINISSNFGYSFQASEGKYYLGLKNDKNKTVSIMLTEYVVDGAQWEIAYVENGQVGQYQALNDTSYIAKLMQHSISFNIRYRINGDTFAVVYNSENGTDDKCNISHGADYLGVTVTSNLNVGVLNFFAVDLFSTNIVYRLTLNVNPQLNVFDINQLIDYRDMSVSITTDPFVTGCEFKLKVKQSTGTEQTKTMSMDFSKTTKLVLLKTLANCNAIDEAILELNSVTIDGKNYQIDESSNKICALKGDKHYSVTLNCMYSRTETKGSGIFKNTIYYISNALQLYNVRENKYAVKLDCDIDVSSCYPIWTPIEELKTGISGNGKTINGVNIRISSVGNGNFGFIAVNSSTISMLTVNIDIRTTTRITNNGASYINVGGMVGLNKSEGALLTCFVNGNITVDCIRSSVGGVIGKNEGNTYILRYGNADTKYTLFGYGNLGGIAGANTNIINDGEANNIEIRHIVDNAHHSVGGVVGYCTGTLKNSCANNICVRNVNSTTVTGYKPKMGLIVGYLDNGELYSVEELNCTYDFGKLSVDSREFCFRGYWPYYGRIDNSTVEGTPNLTNP